MTNLTAERLREIRKNWVTDYPNNANLADKVVCLVSLEQAHKTIADLLAHAEALDATIEELKIDIEIIADYDDRPCEADKKTIHGCDCIRCFAGRVRSNMELPKATLTGEEESNEQG